MRNHDIAWKISASGALRFMFLICISIKSLVAPPAILEFKEWIIVHLIHPAPPWFAL